MLLITHYQRILNYITPDFVHILVDGRIVRSGDAELAKQIEDTGYDPILQVGSASAGTSGEASMTTVQGRHSARDAVGEYKWGFHDDEKPLFMAEKGLNEDDDPRDVRR